MARHMFGPWEPDKPSFQSTGIATARNVYAIGEGYRPIKSFLPVITGSLLARCRGAGSFASPLGTSLIVAGTQTGLYKATSSGWIEIGSDYSLQGAARWRFAQYGALAIATNGADPMLKIDLQTNIVSQLGDGAAPEAGTPPRAKILAGVKDFLVAGVIDDDVRTLAWCGINDAEWWTFGANQSDYQVMPSGGEITGIFGGEVGIVLQRSRISRMTYVGDNLVFQFDEISNNVGCVSPHSTAQWGNLGFFLADSGFMMWDGSALRPIGQERVDRYFKSLYARRDYDNMSTAIDPTNNIVAWSMGDRILFYNWVLDRWSESDAAATVIFPGFSRDTSLEELDAMYGDIDTMTLSLDSPLFLGGDPRFYIFDRSNGLGIFGGANMASVIKGLTVEPASGRTARLRWVRPITDADAGVEVTVACSSRLGQGQSTVVASRMRASGDMEVRATGRFMAFGMNHAAGAIWSYAQGVDFTAEKGPAR